MTASLGPLARTVLESATDIWTDSCAVDDLRYGVSLGAVGATANPTIVTEVWRADADRWSARIRTLFDARAHDTDVDLAWAIVEEMSVEAAPLLLPAFERTSGRQGRLSIQTDPTLFRSYDGMLHQAERFVALAPNLLVKFPTTVTGVAVMEEATFRGISVNATVCFTVGQAVAAAEAVERGMARREAAGLPTDTMGPVITVMMGRLEDWLRLTVDRDGIIIDPTWLPWTGVAVVKEAYRTFRERGFRARLLGAAIRHRLHWTELVGGDLAITVPPIWQRRFNGADVAVAPRIGEPVAASIIDGLRRALPDFDRAIAGEGLELGQFDTFPPTVRTLRAFRAAYRELLTRVGDAMLPDPDRAA